jgi:TolB protein
VSDRSGEFALWIKPPDSPPRKVVNVGGEPVCGPAWSPDGSQVAFPIMHDQKPSIAVMTASGTTMETFKPPDAREINQPAWTADGKALIIPARDTNGGWRLWRAELDGSRPIMPVSAYGWRAIQIHGDAIYQVQSGVPGIWRMDGGMRQVTPLPGVGDEPVFEVDGNRILYLENALPRARIMAQPVDGGPPSVAAEMPPSDRPLFSFDPRTGQIAYVAWLGGDGDLALIALSQR